MIEFRLFTVFQLQNSLIIASTSMDVLSEVYWKGETLLSYQEVLVSAYA